MIPQLALATTKGLHEEIQEERHEDRIEHCGAFYWHIDPVTGQKKSQPRFCGCFRECPNCAAKRIEAEQARIIRAMESGPVCVITVEGEHEQILLNKLRYRKLKYRRFPTEDFAIIFFEVHSDLPGKQVTTEYIEEADWHFITGTPEHCRLSGCLGKTEEEAREIALRFEAPTFRTDATPLDVLDAWESALEATIHFEPNQDTLPDLIRDRINLFATKVAKAGFEVYMSKRAYALTGEDLAKLDWQQPQLVSIDETGLYELNAGPQGYVLPPGNFFGDFWK